jgi:hypothetical protein
MVRQLLSADIPKAVDPNVEQQIDDIVIDYAKTLGIDRDRIPQEFFTD